MDVAESLANVLQHMISWIFDMATGVAEMAIVTFRKANATDVWGAGFSQIWSSVVNISNNVTEPIAAYVVLIMFLLSTVEKVSTEQFTLESLLKDLIKFCMGIYLVTNAVEIVIGCIEIGNGLIQSANNHMFATPSFNELENLFTGDRLKQIGNFFAQVMMWFVFAIFLLFELIIMLCMQATALIRTLEIALRTSMAPIALSDTFTGNILNSHAIGFIRSFAALCLQGVFIAICANMVPLFLVGTFDAVTDPWAIAGALLRMILVSLVSLLLMFRSGSIAKDMLGAR